MLRADAIVLLGCRILPTGGLPPPAARRAATAAAAYHAGTAPLVLVTGGRRWGARIEARALSEALTEAGVPRSAILQELWSLSTFENAVFSAALLRRIQARSAAIVTCPWHMTRALENFRAAGVESVPLPTEADSPPPWTRARRGVHEVVCRWFDARVRQKSAGVLADAAAQALGIEEP